MNEKNGHDVENKYKDTTEKFLNFMKEARLNDHQQKSKEEETGIKLDPTNVTNFVYRITNSLMKAFNKLNYWVDVMLASSKRIRLLSLFMALTLCYFVNGGMGITTTKSIDYINEVPVEVLSNDQYHVIGYDKTVTIQLIGDYGSIQWAKVMGDYKVTLNVSNRTEGNYDVAYAIEGISNNLDIQILPEKTNVNISKKETRSFALGYMFTNEDKKDSAYQLKEPRLAFLEIDVTAGTTTLDRIDRVVASIDVANITGSVVDQNAPIVALDIYGNPLDVELPQEFVGYDLDVISYSKTVPIRLETRGEVGSGFVLTGLRPSVSQVTIYGLESELTNIDHVVAVVDINGKIGNDRISGITIEAPDVVTKISNKTVSVSIELEQKVEKVITSLPIDLQSIPDDLEAKLIGSSTTSVKVTGPKSKIDKLNNTSLKVYVDLSSATVGTAKYDLIIADQDSNIIYEFEDNTSVDVAITSVSGS